MAPRLAEHPFSVRVPVDLFDDFRAACRFNAQTPSDAMRALMKTYALDTARKAEIAAMPDRDLDRALLGQPPRHLRSIDSDD